MGEVAWHPRDEADRETIHDSIAWDSPYMARAFAQRMRSATRRLGRFPLSGRVVPERRKGDVREIPVQGCRVMDRVHGDGVLIVMIRHAARRLGGSALGP